MAYMDEMALEREKSRQAMIAGKQPLLGADTSAALHELGVNLGIVPKGATPSQTTQLLSDLIKGTKGSIRVDDPTPLKVAPLVGKLASLPGQKYIDESAGVAEALTDTFKGAKDSALKKILEDQKKVQGPVPPGFPERPSVSAPPPHSGSPHGDSPGSTGGMREPGQLAGSTYQDDLRFLNDRGGHASVVKDGKITHVPIDTPGAYGQVAPELAARLRSAAEAFEKENPGKQAKFGEFSRGEDVQSIYWKDSEGGTKYAAAEPGKSKHQKGGAGDLPDSDFRKWLYDGNKEKHGLHFPVKNDAPHVEVNPAHTKTYAAPAAPPQPGVSAPGSASTGGHAVLAEQRAPYKAQADANPSMRETMAAIMISESGTPEGRQGTAEAMMNRVNASGKPFTAAMDPAYHRDYMVENRGKYEAALNRIRNEPQLRSEIYSLQDKAFAGSNVSNLATDYSSGGTAAKARGNSTHTFTSPDGQSFFRKDRNPETHGGGTVNAVKQWHAKTDAAVNAKPAAAATPPLAPGTQGPKPTATVAPEYKPTADPQASPQAAPAPEASAAPAETPPAAPPGPQIPVTAPPPPTPAAAAPAPAVPVAAATAPAAPPPAQPPQAAAKPAPTVNPAHALLDTKVIDLVRRGDPSKVGSIPSFVADKTLREAMNMPMIGSAVAAEAQKNLGKAGITPQQFDQAVREGAPKPSAAAGKRSEAPMVPEAQQKVRYAAADTGTLSDASPELPPGEVGPQGGPGDPGKPAGFDPEGTGYDMESAVAAGLKPDETGHWPSRDPESGKLLKGRGHETWPKTVEGERAAGMEIYEKDGRYHSRPQEQGQGQPPPEQGQGQPPPQAQGQGQPPPQELGQMTPGIAQALQGVFQGEAAPPMAPIPAEAMPVLPSQPEGPMNLGAGGGAGGLSLAPSGLSSVPTGALNTGSLPTQGGSIAMAGMLPPIENSTYSSPLLDSTNTGSAFGAGNLTPIPWETLGGWGWGGGGGSGFDFGGGSGFDFGSGMSFGGFD